MTPFPPLYGMPVELSEEINKHIDFADEKFTIKSKDTLPSDARWVNLRIPFATKVTDICIMDSGEVRVTAFTVARELAEEGLLNKAKVIHVNIDDFDFTIFKNFIGILKDKGKLVDFRNPAATIGREPRELVIQHTFTRKSPKTAKKLKDFSDWFATNVTFTIAMTHEVVAYDDIEVLNKIFQSSGFSQYPGTQYAAVIYKLQEEVDDYIATRHAGDVYDQQQIADDRANGEYAWENPVGDDDSEMDGSDDDEDDGDAGDDDGDEDGDEGDEGGQDEEDEEMEDPDVDESEDLEMEQSEDEDGSVVVEDLGVVEEAF
ncbi:hypothetical protein CLAFUW4_03709 [Fulvia fulva]|uniref:uncharacterized protein n=1 Tax=Passalora fulva TaxID=5499 RepID=UPI0004E9EF8F|nr:uncharacterized protein CLAFUR5_20162 [Fulvia fulva]KAK4631760.1 hypothetical protein CLAFUR4_03697 [Fulvia fulva]KAK4632998.1 hypothetical protein CLAFUR0_03700 [Fulvia fulva]WMI38802.1 hypothetical protein CLAFUR5_20162 [Fulvia fulva]WPV10912.1 hypothetical protein CLAFUW4_03709 [Fulvia fulva]WPV25477.1 hypothetical protein CLAFUW7_03701 [Fulvia fulva]